MPHGDAPARLGRGSGAAERRGRGGVAAAAQGSAPSAEVAGWLRLGLGLRGVGVCGARGAEYLGGGLWQGVAKDHGCDLDVVVAGELKEEGSPDSVGSGAQRR